MAMIFEQEGFMKLKVIKNVKCRLKDKKNRLIVLNVV